MRSFIPTLILIISMFSPAAGQWEIINEGAGYDLKCADQTDHTGWIAGNKGVFKFTDQEEKWILLNDSFDFRDIDFIDEMTGWAVICGDSILKTEDGGHSWSHYRAVKDTVNEIQTVDENTIFVAGDSILKTGNGGSDWENITPSGGGYFHSLCFSHPDTGVVAGKDTAVYITCDGGITWTGRNVPEFSQICEIDHSNRSSWYFVAEDTTGKFLLCRTGDLFDSWMKVFQAEKIIESFHLLENGVLLVLMREPSGFGQDTHISGSFDGGASWESLDTIAGYHYLPFFMGDHWYLTGNSTWNSTYVTRSLYTLKSSDGGNHFYYIHLNLPLRDVFALDRDRIFITGGWSCLHYPLGLLFASGDGGRTWENPVYSYHEGFAGVVFANEKRGYITTEGTCFVPCAEAYSTCDGGYSWFADSVFRGVSSIFFLNDSVGWMMVSDQERQEIFHTKDRGEEWRIFPGFDTTCLSVHVNSLFFLNEEEGWAAGTFGDGNSPENSVNLMKYTEGDGWMEMDPGSDLPLNKIVFADREVGWISGGYRSTSGNDDFIPLFLRSVDGGESWTRITGLDHMINDFCFENKDHGWAVGEDREERGVILETFDGGMHWDVVTDTLPARLNSLHVSEGRGWAVGQHGLLLKLEYTPMPGIKDTAGRFMAGHLFQACPNPFRSTARIRYRLTTAGPVEVSVYDISGRKVAALVNAYQAPGMHEVTWHVQGTEPGMYFCRLATLQGTGILHLILME